MSALIRTPQLGAALLAALVLSYARPLPAQTPNVEVTVSGTSTVRSWECAARGVVSVAAGTGTSTPAPGFPNGVQTASLTVPVKSFTCPNQEMTDHLLEAMKADKFSEITFRLEKYEVAGTRAQATGTLTITNVTAPVTLPLTFSTSGRQVQVQGNTRLDMTKFGVDPPVVMLGLLKVSPQVRIEFTATLVP
jgi:polyisoprenoid-binding protein YceI